MSVLFLCGHIEGSDCGSGQKIVNDFVTPDEEKAKSHVKSFEGSWTQKGFYTQIKYEK